MPTPRVEQGVRIGTVFKILTLSSLLTSCAAPGTLPPRPTTPIGLPTVPNQPTPEATSTPTDEQVRAIKTEQSTQSAVEFLRNMRSLATDDIKSLPDDNPYKNDLATIIKNDSLGIVMVESGENFWTPRQYTDGTGNLYALSSVIPQGETLASGRVEALLVEDMTTHKVNVVRFASDPENPNGVLGINQRGEIVMKINDYFENGVVKQNPSVLLVSPNDPNSFTPLSAENIDDNTWRANIQVNYQNEPLENDLAMGGGEFPGGLPTPKAAEATPTVEPTKPTEDSFVIDQNGLTAAYSTKDGESILVTVPDGEGFKLQQEGDKLVLYHEGVYFGEFKPNVTVEGNLTGGWSADATQATIYLEESLAEITEPSDKWLVALPMDMSDIDGPIKITFRQGSSSQIVGIDFDGTPDLANIIPGTNNLIILDAPKVGGMAVYDTDRLTEPCTSQICADKEGDYIAVGGSLYGVTAGTTLDQIKFGARICTVRGPITITYGASQERKDITPAKLLNIGGVPVSIALNP